MHTLLIIAALVVVASSSVCLPPVFYSDYTHLRTNWDSTPTAAQTNGGVWTYNVSGVFLQKESFVQVGIPGNGNITIFITDSSMNAAWVITQSGASGDYLTCSKTSYFLSWPRCFFTLADEYYTSQLGGLQNSSVTLNLFAVNPDNATYARAYMQEDGQYWTPITFSVTEAQSSAQYTWINPTTLVSRSDFTLPALCSSANVLSVAETAEARRKRFL